jgi:hypothetical protein
MNAFVLPNLDQSTIDELRKRIPDMSEFDIPKLEQVGKDVGKTADQALDRLLGRSRMPVWPWVAGSIAVAAIVGAVAAWFTWFRRPTDTLIDQEDATWKAPAAGTNGSSIPADSGVDYASDLGAVATDRTIDSETIGAIGTFGDQTAETYPAAER